VSAGFSISLFDAAGAQEGSMPDVQRRV